MVTSKMVPSNFKRLDRNAFSLYTNRTVSNNFKLDDFVLLLTWTGHLRRLINKQASSLRDKFDKFISCTNGKS